MSLEQHLATYLSNLSNIGVGYAYSGQVEDIERAFLTEYLSKVSNPIVIDVGANVGNYTRTIIKLSPSAQVYSFEPHPESYKHLSEVAKLGNVKTFQCAVGDEEGELELFDLADASESSLASLHRSVIEQLHHKVSRSFTVQVRQLDKMIQELNIGQVHLLKVDTEGHELSVFKSTINSIKAKKIDAVQFEFNEMNVISRTFFKDFLDLLSDYLLIRLTPYGGLPIQDYKPLLHEIFGLQTIVGFRRDLIGTLS